MKDVEITGLINKAKEFIETIEEYLKNQGYEL